MTVAVKGTREGVLFEVSRETGLDSDEPIVDLTEASGTINGDLTVGVDVTKAIALSANDFICSPGVKLNGDGFIVTPTTAEDLGFGRRPGLEKHIRNYRNGRDLMAVPRGVMVIDLFDLEPDKIRSQFPEVYQHVLESVKECKDNEGRPIGRDVNNRASYRVNWWVFGEPRRELRPALESLRRYIATVETSKHRFFQFLDANILPDNMLVCVGTDDAFHLGVLSSHVHVIWALRAGGWLGIGNDPRYSKSRVFDPFPFPVPSDALKEKIRAAAEELDALRKRQQAENPGLTLTQIYNVIEKLRASAKLDAADEAIKTKGLVLIVKELHDELDALVAEAYGWPADLPDGDILFRLVALNAERAAEEKRGLVRWLRPDYQKARAGIVTTAQLEQEQLEAPLLAGAGQVQKPSFPSNDLERTAAVFDALIAASGGLDARTIAKSFKQGTKVEPAIGRVLASLARLGHVHSSDGATFALRRRA